MFAPAGWCAVPDRSCTVNRFKREQWAVPLAQLMFVVQQLHSVTQLVA
jgi:hypothetical protein